MDNNNHKNYNLNQNSIIQEEDIDYDQLNDSGLNKIIKEDITFFKNEINTKLLIQKQE